MKSINRKDRKVPIAIGLRKNRKELNFNDLVFAPLAHSLRALRLN